LRRPLRFLHSSKPVRFLKVALLCVICILLVLVVPSHSGPFSALRGPVTAFQAQRKATLVKLSIAAAAACIAERFVPVLCLCGVLEDTAPDYTQVNASELNCALLV